MFLWPHPLSAIPWRSMEMVILRTTAASTFPSSTASVLAAVCRPSGAVSFEKINNGPVEVFRLSEGPVAKPRIQLEMAVADAVSQFMLDLGTADDFVSIAADDQGGTVDSVQMSISVMTEARASLRQKTLC